MEGNGGSSLAKSTRHSMLGISHFKFQQCLLAKVKADPYGRKDILITTEEFTTKQCPFCIFLYNDIRGSETFWCDLCGFVGERDNVGSFHVLVRSLTKGELNMDCYWIGG